MPNQASTPKGANTMSKVDLVVADYDICLAWVYDWEPGPWACGDVSCTKYSAMCSHHRCLDRIIPLDGVVNGNTVRETEKNTFCLIAVRRT